MAKDDDEEGKTISLKVLASTASTLGVVIGTAFLVDSRYLHAEEYQLAQSVIELRVDKSALEQRQYFVEDKINDLELKPKEARTDFDNARLERYKRDLDDVTQRLRDLDRQERKLRK